MYSPTWPGKARRSARARLAASGSVHWSTCTRVTVPEGPGELQRSPNVISHSAAFSTCEKGGQQERCVGALARDAASGLIAQRDQIQRGGQRVRDGRPMGALRWCPCMRGRSGAGSPTRSVTARISMRGLTCGLADAAQGVSLGLYTVEHPTYSRCVGNPPWWPFGSRHQRLGG